MVDYEVIYYFEYYDKGGLLNRVEILLLEYSGTTSAINDASSNPVILQHSGTSVETVDFIVIQGQELQFSFFVPDDDVATFDAIFESDFKDYKIRYYINSQLEFEGYIKPENLSRNHFRNEPFTEFKLSATDGLADLKNITFYDLDELVVSTRHRIIDIIKYALHSLNIDLDFVITLNTYETTLMASNECALDVVYVDGRRFLNDDGTPWNCWDVIEATLKEYNVQLKQHKGKYYITNYYEINSYYYAVDWATTTFAARVVANNIVDVTSYAYESSSPTVKKVAPIKRITGIIHNKDLGVDITGFNLADFINVWDAYNYETIDTSSSILSWSAYADLIQPFYIETTNSFGIVKISEDDYLRISVDAVLYPLATFFINSNISVRIVFEVLHPDGIWRTSLAGSLGLYYQTIVNSFDTTAHITTSGNYKVRIRVILLTNPTFNDKDWREITDYLYLPHELYSGLLKNISITRVSMSTNEDVESVGDVPIVTYDISYKRENPTGIKIVDSEIYFIDSVQLTQMSALSIYTSEFESTSKWNSLGHLEELNLLSIYTKYIFNNRYNYKNSIRATYIDFANTIGFNNILQIQSKYYQIITFSKNTKDGKISLELSELLIASELQTIPPLTLSIGDTINGSVSSKSVNAITITNTNIPLNDLYAYLPGRAGGQWLIGGTAAGDQLIFQGTSANGTGTTKAIVFKTGNNGSLELFSLQNNGVVNINASTYIDLGNSIRLSTPGSNSFALTMADGTGNVITSSYSGLMLGSNGLNVIVNNTNFIAATIYGGTAVGSSLSLIGTTTNGTSSTNAILFKVGNNGATTAGYIKNTGHFYIPLLNHENGFYWQSQNTENGRLSLIHTDGTIFNYLTSTGITLGMSVGVTGSVTASTYMSIGTYAGSPSFVSGFAGSGWRMALESGNANLSVDNLWVRKSMTVYELIINQIRSTNGSLWVTDAVKLDSTTYIGGDYACGIDLDDGNIAIPFIVGDIVRCQRWTGSGVKYYTAEVSLVDASHFEITILEGAGIPAVNDVLVRIGNSTSSSRQGSIYLTASDSNAPYLDVMDEVDSASFSGKTKVRLGKLTGITDALFGALSGYGLYAGNAYLTGGINASTGAIGGFTINTTEGLYAGTGSTRVQMKPGAGIWCGETNIEDALFSVTNAGVLKAQSGTIGSWTITSGPLYRDTGTNSTSSGLSPTDYPVYAGATYANRASAPFRVTPAGAVTCSNITATGGTIAGFTIDATEGIYAGTGATRVQMKPGAGFWAGATARDSAPFRVTEAGKLFCTSLDIKTSATGQRVELNSTDNILTLYASNGVDYVQIKTMPTDQPVVEIAWYDYLTQLAGGYLRIADDSSLGGSQFRVSTRAVYEPLEVAMEGLPTIAEVGGSGWKILYVHDTTGQVAREV